VNPETIIATKSLSFSYPNGAAALREVTLTIGKGRKVALLGPNGAGKSTLFLHFNGILKPASGSVSCAGAELSYRNKDLYALREKVALVLQNPDDQIFSATVEEDIAFGPLNLELDRAEVEACVKEAIALVGLDGLEERPTQQLSFGQRKRVALAGALAMRPEVLILDEPTAGLDPKMVSELLEITEEINARGVTVIMSTHEVEIALGWADDVLALRDGKVVYTGDPEGLLYSPAAEKAGLAVPLLVRANSSLAQGGGIPHGPHPRTLAEMSAKAPGPKPAQITMLDANVMLDPAKLREAVTHTRDSGGIVAVMGTLARSRAAAQGIRAELSVDALDTSIEAALCGTPVTVIAAPSWEAILTRRIARVNGMGGRQIPALRR
jgi:cobalt/nickel transport system ATP-binding protein